MSIPVRCACGKKLAAPYNLAGKRVKCPHCHQPLEVPQLAAAVEHKAVTTISVICGCGKRVAVPQRLVAKAVKCPACGNPLRAASRAAEPPPPTPAETVGPGLASILDEVGALVAKGKQSCPQCKAAMEPDAVLCVSCGFHVDRGRQLKTRRIGRRA